MPEKVAAASEWADISDSDVEQLIALARAEGWDRALEVYATKSPFFVARLRNVALGNWHVLLTRPTVTRPLDVGCGFGALVTGLGASYARAAGIEMLPERLRFAALRPPTHPIELVRGSGHTLPFAADSFDLVTMNGVLEWAAHYVEGHPRALQLNMLREARRVLRPAGALAVAIENRFALETLLGMRDTHTGLHLVPALPRMLADGWSRLRRGKGYRTYLYSRRGYESLFKKAGFPAVQVLDLVPSYNDYDFVVAPGDRATYSLLWRQGWVRSFGPGTRPVRRRLAQTRPGWLGGLSYAYLVLGSEQPTALESSHGLWTAVHEVGLQSDRARFAANLTEAGGLAILTHDGKRLSGLVSLSREPTGQALLQRLRSRPLAQHLEGRLVRLGGTAYCDFQLEAYSVA